MRISEGELCMVPRSEGTTRAMTAMGECDAFRPSNFVEHCSSHGTHTASTAAGTQYGIAKVSLQASHSTGF